MSLLPPAPRPCESCPYRLDVPSGVWAPSQYARLALFDRPTVEQPVGVFMCHQNDRGDDRSRVCAGWAGCHDGEHLLALRLAPYRGVLTPEVVDAVREYVSPVPLFESGKEAAVHGMREIHRPGPEACALMDKIERRRPGVAGDDGLTPSEV